MKNGTNVQSPALRSRAAPHDDSQQPTVAAPRLRLMLVDDHAAVRAGYRRLLEDEPDLVVVAEHGSADTAYAELSARPLPAVDLLVLDLSMPGRSGLDVLRRIRMRWPVLRTLVFSMHESPAMVAQALQAGADGFVTKSSEPAELLRALRRVAGGECGVLSADLAGALQAHRATPAHLALTAREFEVLRGLVEGLTLEQIAQRLHVSPKTISNLQTQVRHRLGVATAVDLLRYAREHRLLTL